MALWGNEQNWKSLWKSSQTQKTNTACFLAYVDVRFKILCGVCVCAMCLCSGLFLCVCSVSLCVVLCVVCVLCVCIVWVHMSASRSYN